MNHNEYFGAVIEAPEDDELRLGYARALGNDPWGRFVELQVSRIRDHRSNHRSGSSVAKGDEWRLHHELSRQMARQVLMYTPRFARDPVEFHRGFIVRMHVDPRTFLEHGEYLFRIAPLRGIDFYGGQGSEAGRAHLTEVLASPLLQRLDYVGFDSWSLSPAEVSEVLHSPNLTRCLSLNLGESDAGRAVEDAIRTSRVIKQILRFWGDYSGARSYSSSKGEPKFGEYVGDDVREYRPTGVRGKERENALGYLPWIHPEHVQANDWDLRYFLEKGILPARPVGSLVDYVKDPDDGNPGEPIAPPVTRVYD
jgi:hypothetical protein